MTPFFLSFFYNFSSELLMFFTFLTGGISLVFFLRFFGFEGMIAYGVVAIIVANIQVLKISPCHWYPEPVALGTIVFSSLYLCSDIVTEFYGAAKAKQLVWLNFFTLMLLMVWMLLTLAHPVVNDPYNLQVQEALETLFLPTPALVAASLIAYLISQYNDIWIFATLKRLTKGAHLWLRTSLSNLISGFLDHVLFSVLAWVVFAAKPMAWQKLWWSYILGAYGVRALILLLHTPLIYLVRRYGNPSPDLTIKPSLRPK